MIIADPVTLKEVPCDGKTIGEVMIKVYYYYDCIIIMFNDNNDNNNNKGQCCNERIFE